MKKQKSDKKNNLKTGLCKQEPIKRTEVKVKKK
jgi:hypothetical protein